MVIVDVILIWFYLNTCICLNIPLRKRWFCAGFGSICVQQSTILIFYCSASDKMSTLLLSEVLTSYLVSNLYLYATFKMASRNQDGCWSTCSISGTTSLYLLEEPTWVSNPTGVEDYSHCVPVPCVVLNVSPPSVPCQKAGTAECGIVVFVSVLCSVFILPGHICMVNSTGVLEENHLPVAHWKEEDARARSLHRHASTPPVPRDVDPRGEPEGISHFAPLAKALQGRQRWSSQRSSTWPRCLPSW